MVLTRMAEKIVMESYAPNQKSIGGLIRRLADEDNRNSASNLHDIMSGRIAGCDG